MARTEHIGYINIYGYEFRIEDTTHCDERAQEADSSRYCFDGQFVVNRIAKALEREEVVNALVNGVLFGEKFVLQDVAQHIDIAICYDYDKCSGHDLLTAMTTRRRLRVWDGQKVIRVLADRVIFGRWNNTKKKLEVEE